MHFNPLQLFSKRLLGMASLLVRRARKFRLERAQEVVDRVLSLEPDHILITGDLTTTALPAEFRAARRALEPLAARSGKDDDPARAITTGTPSGLIGTAGSSTSSGISPRAGASLAPLPRPGDRDPRA